MATLHLFDRAAVAGLPLVPAVNLRDAMPFCLDDDGTPLWELNRFLRSLPNSGALAPSTWTAYARDLKSLHEFLEQRGARLLDFSSDDIDAYHAYRRTDGDLGSRLSPASWNRAVSAFDRFVSWSLQQGLRTTSPFSYRSARVPTGERWSEVQVNLAKEKAGRRGIRLQWLEQEWLDRFIDVGCSGLDDSGRPDPTFRGRHRRRNAAVAATMAGSGLRHTEALSLLEFEWPADPVDEERIELLTLPGTICKGARQRTIWLHSNTIRRVNLYRRTDRSDVASSTSWQPARPLVVTRSGPHGGTVDGQRVRWSELSVGERRRLVLPSGASPLLFLGDAGAPLLDMKDAFDAASERCRTVQGSEGKPTTPDFPHVHPHRLRHTFAVLTLRWLQETHFRGVLALVRRGTDDPYVAELVSRHDPLLILRDLLGHASIRTTEIYLGTTDPVRLLRQMELEAELDDRNDDL